MSSNTTSELLSFKNIISKYNIEIPKIQRDYAQGRKGKEELRENFLFALFDAISKNEILELDFVYGSVMKNELQPLDGQQRLTTLFLLHWYIASKENKLDTETKNILMKFTYETRASSREFCHALIQKGIDFENLLPSDIVKNGNPNQNELSKTITDSVWYFLSWNKDPTIQSMLTMVNAIHHKFKDTFSQWEKLNNIRFHFIELKNFGLSDDLYIKMNARGKALTEYESFKAKFEQHIKRNSWEENLSVQETFSHKIDTEWTDLFWKYRDKISIDDAIIKFISAIAISNYAEDYEENKKEFVERIAALSDNPNCIQPDYFYSKNGFENLTGSLNVYANDNVFNSFRILSEKMSFWGDYFDNSIIFEFIIAKGKKISYKERVIFFALTKFVLIKESFQSEDVTLLSNWIRVVRNIIHNSTIDSAATFIGAIRLVKELASGCDNIYEYLSKNEIESKFASPQVKEEIKKSKIIISQEFAKMSIHGLEDTNFCKGKIDFFLYCVDYNDGTKLEIEKLDSLSKLCKAHFNDQDFSNDIRRGLLTIDNNNYFEFSRWWLPAVEANKRCLIQNTEELRKYAYNDHFKHYLKELLLQLVNHDLISIINEYEIPVSMPNWKARLIKEKGLLDYSRAHYFAHNNEKNCCWLLQLTKVANSDEGIARLKKIE